MGCTLLPGAYRPQTLTTTRTIENHPTTSSQAWHFARSRNREHPKLQSLTCFHFSAFSQRRFPRKFYAAFVVDSDELDPNHVADLHHILGSLHSKIGELGNVHQPVFAWKNFNK